MSDVFNITCSALPEETRVAGFRGTEGLSRPYEFDLYLVLGAEGLDLDLADAIGAKAKLEIDRADGRPPFLFHGIFSAFELLHEFGGRSLFHATLVPQLWQLTQTFHSRIFTKMTIPDIIKEVLEDGGLAGDDFTFKLAQTYKTEEHVCQYLETHLDFISRWMEREGMYYYFEQGEGSERLVITDNKSFHGPLPEKPVRFFALGGHDGSAGEALHTFTCKHRALPANVKLKDYDYTKPTLDVSGTAPVSKTGLGEISVYGGRFFTPDDGKRLAKIRAEELLARQVVYRGAGSTLYMRPGYLFTLEDHPRSAFDAAYLVMECDHVGNQMIGDPHLRELTGIETDKVYWVEVTAIPGKSQFRAESKTAWPRIYGFENGTVGGPADSDYAQIDDHGRYNVKFKFDESDLKGGKSSTWVRMMQPHGGNPEGFHFPLRKGTEVTLMFLGGDADRPVISGVVPDTTNPSPITSGNHTKNIIHTGGDNHFELEDLAGQQRVTLSTPHAKTTLLMGNPQDGHEFIATTEGNSLHNTDLDHKQVVGQNTDITIGANHTEDIGGEKSVHVAGEVEANHDKSYKFTTGDDWEVEIGADKKELTVGSTTEILIGDKTEAMLGTSTELTVGNEMEASLANVLDLTVGNVAEITIANKMETTIGNSMEVTVGNVMEITVANKMEVTVGAMVDIKVGASMEVMVGPAIEIATCEKIELTPEAVEAKADKTKLEALETEMKGVHSQLTGAKDAIHGLKQATVGLKSLEAGVVNHDLALRLVNAGLNNTAAGLTLME